MKCPLCQNDIVAKNGDETITYYEIVDCNLTKCKVICPKCMKIYREIEKIKKEE